MIQPKQPLNLHKDTRDVHISSICSAHIIRNTICYFRKKNMENIKEKRNSYEKPLQSLLFKQENNSFDTNPKCEYRHFAIKTEFG